MIPGPPVAYAGLLLLHFTDKTQFSTTQLLLWLASSRPCTDTLDYFVPMLGSKYSGGSSLGTRARLIGTIVGLFFMPWGIILGPFLGAFAGELMGGSKTDQALKSGLGSLLGFLLGTVVKCVICAYLLGVRQSLGLTPSPLLPPGNNLSADRHPHSSPSA